MSEAQQREERKHQVWSATAAMEFVKSEQRLSSQHHPKTWSQADQFDYECWTAHDNNAGGLHNGPYALCEMCRECWRQWKADRLAEKLAAAAMAESL